MPEGKSKEKESVIKGLGAEVIRTPKTLHYTDPESYMGVALRLEQEIPGAIILDQVNLRPKGIENQLFSTKMPVIHWPIMSIPLKKYYGLLKENLIWLL